MTPIEKRKAKLVSEIIYGLNTRYGPGSGLRQQLEASLAKNLSLNTLGQLLCVTIASAGYRPPARPVVVFDAPEGFDEMCEALAATNRERGAK